MKHFSSTLLILLLLTLTGFAQKKKFDFDKIVPADFSLSGITDTTAEAVVVADVGSTRFEYGDKGFFLVFERKTRIHILKPEGSSFATIEIPLYKSGSNRERMNSFKGTTYNLEKGEVVKTKVRSEDIFKDEKSENWDHQKIAMPAVKPNSIIEYQYEIRSDFTFNLQSWTFQNSIPVLWSEYSVIIPEYFEYKKISHGYVPFTVNEESYTTQKFTVHVAASLSQQGFQTDREPAHDDVYQPGAKEYHWVTTNVPALKAEPYLTTVYDYLSSIEFELSIEKMPGSTPRQIADNWQTLNDKLLDSDYFGKAIKKGGFISDQLPKITANAASPAEKALAIYDHIRDRVKWDGDLGISADKMPKKVYEDRTGSAAEINLMLVAVLREAGLTADPVILSTRSHGMIMEMYPILAKFNYVIARVQIDTLEYLLDATSPYTLFNTLPERCLNGTGRIISKERAGWANLLKGEMRNEYTNASFTLAADGALSGSCSLQSRGISGNEHRNSFKSMQRAAFLKEFNTDHSNWNIQGFEYLNLDTLSRPFTENYTLEVPDGAQQAGERMYLNCMAGLGMKSNPFKLEKRTYPVDFSCPIKEVTLVRINIPEGWSVEEMPKAAVVSLPEKSAMFKIMLAQGSGFIQITNTLLINKKVFLPEEYEQLKEFFRMIVAKHAEQIVLKKA